MIVLRRIAEEDYAGAVARYENERGGLDTEFPAVIEQHFKRIAENPEPKRIVIPSVFHSSRGAKQLKNRR